MKILRRMKCKIESMIFWFMFNCCGFLSDRLYTRIIYKLKTGKKLNLKNPQTFNEKLQWLKLNDHNPLYTTLVDKYAVKQWVVDKIGSEYVIPTLGVWDRPEDIDWDSLPDQFVLKTTHGGGGDGVVICKDKAKLNKAEVLARLRKSMKTDPYKRLREWPYKNVKRQIIAEKYMISNNNCLGDDALVDYKFFCFDGLVKYLFVATDRNKAGEDVKFDYFDAEFNHLELRQQHPMSGKEIQKPHTFDEMKRVASLLSKGFPEVRCDLYEINGKVYFGEMTFFHHGGVTPFHPESWDYEWGKCITLPENTCNY